jgi:hypothetical protein
MSDDFFLPVWLPPGPTGGPHTEAVVTLQIDATKEAYLKYGETPCLILRWPQRLDQLRLNRAGATALGDALIRLGKGVR